MFCYLRIQTLIFCRRRQATKQRSKSRNNGISAIHPQFGHCLSCVCLPFFGPDPQFNELASELGHFPVVVGDVVGGSGVDVTSVEDIVEEPSVVKVVLVEIG